MRRISEQKAGVLLSYVNLALGTIIPLFYTPIMLDILGQSEYGLYSLSHSVTSYLNLLNLGIGSAIVRYVAKCRAENDHDGVQRLMGLFLAIYGVMALAVCAVGSGMAIFSDQFFANGLSPDEISRMRILVLIMTLSVAISLPISTFSSVIAAYERFVFVRTLAICQTVAIPVLNLVVLYLGKGSIGMTLVGLSVQVIASGFYVVYCAKKVNIVPQFRNMPVDLLKELAGFCFFVFLATIVDMLYWSTDKVLIGATLGTVAVAVYNVGGVFTSVMQSMAQALSQVFTPRVMMMASKKDKSMEEISALMIRVGRLQSFIVYFILSGYFVFGQRFLRVWSGEGYEDAFYIALLTMIPLTVPLIQGVAFSTITAQNKHRFRAVIYAVIAVVNVVSTWLVLPYWGIIGAAVCTAIAFALGNGIVMNIYYYRVIKLDIPGFWKSVIKIIGLTAVLALGSWLVVNRLVTAQSVWVLLIGAAIYSVIFWLMNWFLTMNQYEKQMLLGILKKRS